MGKKIFFGLLMGLGFSAFVLANTRDGHIPILTFPLFYAYGVGFTFGWARMKGWLAHACGAAASVDYWLIIALFFRRHGILWGLGLFMLYIGFAVTFGIWYGIFLFCAGIVKKLFPHAAGGEAGEDSAEGGSDGWTLWANFLVVCCALGLLAWNSWPLFPAGNASGQAHPGFPAQAAQHAPASRQEIRGPASSQIIAPSVAPAAMPSAAPTATPPTAPQAAQPVPEWKKTFPLRPGTSAYGLLEGQWQGGYVIGKKERNLQLEVTANNAGQAVALFTFDTSAKARRKEFGQFSMVCKYDPQANTYQLIAADWQNKIGGYRMVNLKGAIGDRKFSGSVLDVNSGEEIGKFTLTKMRK